MKHSCAEESVPVGVNAPTDFWLMTPELHYSLIISFRIPEHHTKYDSWHRIKRGLYKESL